MLRVLRHLLGYSPSGRRSCATTSCKRFISINDLIATTNMGCQTHLAHGFIAGDALDRTAHDLVLIGFRSWGGDKMNQKEQDASVGDYGFLMFLTLLNVMNFVDRQLLASFANWIVPDLA